MTLPSNWDFEPTDEQISCIIKLCMILGIKEHLEDGLRTRREARNQQYELLSELKRRNQTHGRHNLVTMRNTSA